LPKQYLSTERQADQSDKGVPTLLYDNKQNTIVLEYVSPDGEQLNYNDNGNKEQLSYSTKSYGHVRKPSSDSNIARVDDGADTLIATEPHEGSAEINNVVIEDVNQIEDILLNDEGFKSYLAHLREHNKNAVGTGKTIQDNPGIPNLNAVSSLPEGTKPDPVDQPHLNQHDSLKTFQLEKVFEPSATPTDSDWFILDENGKRQRTMSKNEIEEVKHIIEISATNENTKSNKDKEKEETEPNAENKESLDTSDSNETTTQDHINSDDKIFQNDEVKMYGGFEPSMGPN
jgi:hypothetical protein